MSNPISTSSPPQSTPPLLSIPGADAGTRVRWLRAEISAADEGSRKARLLAELGEAEERGGDHNAAAREYLAAYEADPNFRESLEGLVRLFERRGGLDGLSQLFNALVDASAHPDERVRALFLRAEYEAEAQGDLAAAMATLRDATEVEGSSVAEQANAWLTLEIMAGRSKDSAAREGALAKRAEQPGDATWRALLRMDRARLLVESGDIHRAVRVLEDLRADESEATWAAATLLELVLRSHPGVGSNEATARAASQAGALEFIAGLVQTALTDEERADALGVPRWAREPGRETDAWLRAAEARRSIGQLDSAALALDRALLSIGPIREGGGRLAEAAVLQARIRLAEQTGDMALAAQLAARRLGNEDDRSAAASLALRIAEHAALTGDATGAIFALARAIESDPGCLPARALQLDVLADGPDGAAFAEQLEAFAEHLTTDQARGRAFLLAAYVWGVRAHDVGAAKAALTQSALFDTPPEIVWRTARVLASMGGDASWYEEATRRLAASEGSENEAVSLCIELLRLRDARGDAEGAARALNDLSKAPGGAFIGRVLKAFLPPSALEAPLPLGGPVAARAALEDLSAGEVDETWAPALAMVAAMRAHAGGDVQAAREHLRRVEVELPEDATATAYALDLDRAADDPRATARSALRLAAATVDAELSSALRLEAAFESYRVGDVSASLREAHALAANAPEAAHVFLGWASWTAEPDDLTARGEALLAAERAGGGGRALALERFAAEVANGDASAAESALNAVESVPGDALGLAAALARLVWSPAASSPERTSAALTRVGQEGPRAALFAAAERVRLAREAGDAALHLLAARAWETAGGGAAAAFEWLATATNVGDPREEMHARLALAMALPSEDRDSLLASAAILQPRVELDRPSPLLVGQSPALLLTNLELAPPGCDPRRRASVLEELGDVLGEEAALDALSLAAWARLLASDFAGALAGFQKVVGRRPTDISAWEGIRHSAERSGEHALRADAAARLGALCSEPRRGAAFWEEAALVWLELNDDSRADEALDASFARDPSRSVAFDRMFRRIRERKDNAKLLDVIARRLQVSEDSTEIQRLFWEQARTLRELGDQDGALAALDHVTMLDANHVGALALLGEINLRRGKFEEAAGALAQLAGLENAPARNRATAGIAAVDIFENKLGSHERARDVLLSLHRSGLATLPVRERLARAAARTGSWADATEILEALMVERPDSAGRAEAARLAMAIRRDRLADPQGAGDAVVRLLAELPTDPEALEMLTHAHLSPELEGRLLSDARAGLVQALRERPTDANEVRRLAFVARRLRDDATEQAALGVLAALGASDAPAEQAFAQLAARKQRLPQTALPSLALRTLLAPGDAGPIADLFAVLGPTLAGAFGPSLQSCGVTRRDKVDPRSGLALRNEIGSWAGALGVRDFDLYVGGKDPLGIQGVPGEPNSLVVGAGVNAPLAPLTRARVARELLATVRGITVTRSRDEVTIAAIVVAACRQGDVRFEHPSYAVLAEVDKLLARSLARRTRKLLPELCRAIVATGGDARGWSKRALASLDRIATVASGDPAVVLSDVLGVPIERLGTAVAGHPRAEELLRFVLSPAYIEVRRSLGLEGGS